MIKNRNRLSVFSLISLLLFFSCKDETSLILNPENGNNYSIKTFTLNESESESFLINSFNSGESPRSYIGNIDQTIHPNTGETITTTSHLLLKISKDLIKNSNVCNVDNLSNILNDFDIKLTMVTNLDIEDHESLGYEYVPDGDGDDYPNILGDMLPGPNQGDMSFEETSQTPIKAYFIDDLSNLTDYDEDSANNHNPSNIIDFATLDNNHSLKVDINYDYDVVSIDFLNYFVGSDGCPDIHEDGNGGCLELVYDSESNSDNYNIDPNSDNDTDDCPDVFEDGSGSCIEFVYNNTSDEDSDDYNIDPNGDNIDCSPFDNLGDCEGSIHCEWFDEGEECMHKNSDNCPDFYENGIGGCIDLVYNSDSDSENYNIDPNSDNDTDDCPDMFEDGNGGCISLVYNQNDNPDPNSDNEYSPCELEEDIFIVLKFEPFDDIDYIEFYSTDNTVILYKPYLYMNYDTLKNINQSMKKYSVNSLNLNNDLNGSTLYSISEMDTINIIGFNGLDENIDTTWDHDDNPLTPEKTCLCHHSDPAMDSDEIIITTAEDCGECSDVCSWEEDTCMYNEYGENLGEGQGGLIPIIDDEFNGEIFNFEITLDPEYIAKLSEEEIEDDIIKLKFKDVSFIYDDSDPSNDNYEEDDNPDGAEGNGYFDYDNNNSENFYDYGYDLCPDEHEAGDGTCDEENTLYNVDGKEDNGAYDEGEIFEDTGSDGCFNTLEDGNGECTTAEDSPYDELTNKDPNGDDYNIDPSEDEWKDLGEDKCPDNLEDGSGGCTTEELSPYNSEDPESMDYNIDPNGDNYEEDVNDNGTQGNGTYNFGEGTEENGVWDHADTGSDGCYDWLENGSGGCTTEESSPYDETTNQDPNNDNFEEGINNGTQGNGRIDELDVGGFEEHELFLDFGIDQLSDEYENYNEDYDIPNDNWPENPEGTEGNGYFDQENGYNEIFFDTGLDGLENDLEFGHNSDGTENNNQHDEDEILNDTGLDGCLNIKEDGIGGCTTEEESPYDEIENSDPNDDDYNVDPNEDNYPLGKEGNESWDHEDTGSDGCFNIEEDGSGGCTTVELSPYDEIENPDPNSDDWSEDNEVGTEGNDLDDDGEIYETYEDYGYDLLENQNENNYLANYADLSLGGNLFYVDPYNNEENGWTESGTVPTNNNDDVLLWIDSITKIGEYSYNLSVHIQSLIDIIAFEIHLYHDNLSYQIESMEEEQLLLFPYENESIDENNIISDNEGAKYILDASLYEYPEFDESDLMLSYGYGMKSKLVFEDDDGNSFISFINELKAADGFTLFSDEFSNIILSFKNDDDSHRVENSTNIILEYLNVDSEDYNIFAFTESINSQDITLSIPIASFMQSHIVDDINISDIYLNTSENDFNFSRISLDPSNIRLEIFYSE